MLAAAHHVEMVRTTDKGDAAGTGLYHVLGCLLRCHVAIAYHLRELVFQTAAGKEHQRYAHVMKLLEVRIVGGILRQTGDDAFHMHVEEVVQRLCLALMVLMTVGTDDRVAQLRRIVLDAVEHCGIIMGHQIGYYHANHSRSLLSKTLSKRIRPVIKLLGKLLHLLGHFLPHLVAIAQSTRHSGNAHT